MATLFQDCRFYPHSRGKRHLYWLSVATLLTTFVITVYAHTLTFWWSYDDAHHLRFALTHKVSNYLFDPNVYRKFHDLYLAPWNILTYSVNLSLFGMEPSYFYVRQIIAACLLAFVTFFLLRLWINSAWALAGVLFYSISPAASTVVGQLMNTHYLEGLLFTSIAIACFVTAIRQDRYRIALIGAVFYFLATSAKEIFVPLALALTFLPERSLLDRLRYLLPFYAVSLFYVVWRNLYIVDSFSSWTEYLDPYEVAILPWRFFNFLFGLDTLGMVASALVLGLLLIVLRSRPGWLLFSAIALICLFIPLIPVSYETSANRFHVLVTWCLWCMTVCVLYQLSKSSRVAVWIWIPVVAVIGMGSLKSSVSAINQHTQLNTYFRAVGEFVMHEDAKKTLFLPGFSYSANEVKKLRRILDMGKSPKLLFDPIQFCKQPVALNNLHVLDRDQGTIVDRLPYLDSLIEDWQSNVTDNDLQVRMVKTDSGLEWAFGPYANSTYSVILQSTQFTFTNVAAAGLYRAGLPPTTLMVKYTSPDGWVTYSKMLTWENDSEQPLEWARGSNDLIDPCRAP